MQKIEKILLPIDFSSTSADSFQYGLHLASIFHASIHLLHVREFSASVPEFTMVPMIAIAPDFTIEQMDIFIEQTKKDQEVLKLDHIAVTYEIIAGSPASEIIRFSEDGNANLIVLGSVGLEDFADKLAGSVSWKVIYNASCPVLIVPLKGAFKPINCILYATNEESTSPQLIRELEFLNVALGAQVHFIYMDSEGENEIKEETIHQLSDNITNAAWNEIPHIERLEKNNSLSTFKEYIARNKVDLVIFATRHRGFWSRLFSDNLTEKITVNIDVPFLFFHKNDKYS